MSSLVKLLLFKGSLSDMMWTQLSGYLMLRKIVRALKNNCELSRELAATDLD